MDRNSLSGAQSSRKSSVSTAAPEVLVTRPADKDRDAQNEAATNNEAKPKNVLSLLPVINLQTIYSPYQNHFIFAVYS